MSDRPKVVRQYYTDHKGIVREVPRVKGILRFKVPLHAALRAYIFHRDGYRCCYCGAYALQVPPDYNGRYTLRTNRGLCLVTDHKTPIRLGGTHHPDNLQTLCDSCNARKSCREDCRLIILNGDGTPAQRRGA